MPISRVCRRGGWPSTAPNDRLRRAALLALARPRPDRPARGRAARAPRARRATSGSGGPTSCSSASGLRTSGARGRPSSGGEQRVAVCAALAHRPKLLLADEPTGELDAASAGLVYELIGELAREHGCTTVLVSHDVESTAIADRTVRVRDGRVSEETERGDGETLVVARGGVRLPEGCLVRARIGSRARASSESGDRRLGRRRAARGRGRRGAGSGRGRKRRRARRGARWGSATGRGAGDRRARRPRRRLPRGRLTAVTGPSGSGKTTPHPGPARPERRERQRPRRNVSRDARSAPLCGATRSRSSRRIPA